MVRDLGSDVGSLAIRRRSLGRPEDGALLTDLARAEVARDAGTWEIRSEGFWCYLLPADEPRRDQGWKLHVSATPLSAPLVLARAAHALVRHRCAFKFAATLDRVAELVSTRAPRGSGGKFITVYPRDDEQLRAVAEDLHQATVGLPGPGVLSDRRYLPGSLVSYRYGVFWAKAALTNDGTIESRLRAPDGTPLADERNAWFSPPPWAGDPFPERAATPPRTRGTAKPVLLGDRFVIREAIQHANKGGVYRGVDTTTGQEVVVKQGRRHVGAGLDGTDARDVVRHEAAMLERFAGTGVTPAVVALFEQQDSALLAQESVPGASLRQVIVDRLAATGRAHDGLADALATARALVDLVATAHRVGVTLGDFNPNNVMVTPQRRFVLIDLEVAAAPGTRWITGVTAGYAAPELVAAPGVGPTPGFAVDLFALGATLVYALTGTAPSYGEDYPTPRPVQDRNAALVRLLGDEDPVLALFEPVLLGLTRDAADQRWTLDRVVDFLDTLDDATPAPPPPARRDRRTAADRARVLEDGLTFLVRTMNPTAERLWRSSKYGETNEPCSIQHGSAGVLAVLADAQRHRPRPDLLDAVLATADWTADHLDRPSSALPGLYFGRSGTAWALHDAAGVLADPALAARAADLACALPTDWPNPDVCHGIAGAGLAAAHLWRATGEPRFLDRVRAVADQLLKAAVRHEDGVFWPIPADFDSGLAGVEHYGFAHGVAGVGAFLLAAADATGDAECLAVAEEAGHTLAAGATLAGGAATWRTDRRPNSGPPEAMRYWCNGSSGVGTFVARLAVATGRQEFRDLAEQAAVAVHRGRRSDPVAVCHGLAGNAEYLLDLADLFGEPRFRDWAEDLTDQIVARTVLRGDLMVVPDESGIDVVADYSTGLSGVLALLLRLEHGGRRRWLP
ncbi:protein kinase/lanthionine synthetase C family protein [Solihabitans fulvus]|uniref:Protein kinase/lanthionine synthetase C family protein n=1 Tax=Solihabitans fulvus TaxID=1892852 RepID=A0A5B2XQJ3_9PSEU|nr:class IV lanthionine synthetase LanL [Solihabitans fulvus]KAA2265686.1 protein kinase/lanthionine synthetase C family protein [Solihabitans fulvus]